MADRKHTAIKRARTGTGVHVVNLLDLCGRIDASGTLAALKKAGFADAFILRTGSNRGHGARDQFGDKFRCWIHGDGGRVWRMPSPEPVMIEHCKGWRARLPTVDAAVANILGKLTSNPEPADFDPAAGGAEE